MLILVPNISKKSLCSNKPLKQLQQFQNFPFLTKKQFIKQSNNVYIYKQNQVIYQWNHPRLWLQLGRLIVVNVLPKLLNKAKKLFPVLLIGLPYILFLILLLNQLVVREDLDV